jgi:hypothetical protein
VAVHGRELQESAEHAPLDRDVERLEQPVVEHANFVGEDSAATGEINGQRITYVCEGGGLLVGFTHRTTPTWTIWYASTFTSKHLELVTIADAWRQ